MTIYRAGKESAGEAMMAFQMVVWKLPKPRREYQFVPDRKWRFDFAWPTLMVAVEVEGGTWSGGRHTTGAGFAADCDKYNRAALEGWRVFRFPTKQVKDGVACATLKQALSPVVRGK